MKEDGDPRTSWPLKVARQAILASSGLDYEILPQRIRWKSKQLGAILDIGSYACTHTHKSTHAYVHTCVHTQMEEEQGKA